MKKISISLIIVFVLLLAIIASIIQYKSNEKDVVDWVVTNGEEIVQIDDRGIFDSGPYVFCKNTIYFKVITDKHNVYWFKYNVFGREIQKEIENGYQIIEK